MMAILDTVALQHLVRKPKKKHKRAAGSASSTYTALDPVLKDRRLLLGLDSANSLLTEWQNTCGQDIHVVVTTWGDWGALIYINNPPKLGHCTARKLRQLQFADPIDKLVIRLSLALTTKFIITEDSDFWDPTDKEAKGDPKAPVAAHCSREHGIRIWLLGEFLQHVGCAHKRKTSKRKS
jgi:hypothetical protein